MTRSDQIKSLGLKVTTPRKRVLELFETSEQRHFSADEVYRTLIGEGFDVGLATVYRVLTQFEQAGILIRHNFDGDKAIFELNQGEHHDHLLCMQCGRVEEFHDETIEKRQKAIAKAHGYTLRDHHLVLYVECERKDCPNRK